MMNNKFKSSIVILAVLTCLFCTSAFANNEKVLEPGKTIRTIVLQQSNTNNQPYNNAGSNNSESEISETR